MLARRVGVEGRMDLNNGEGGGMLVYTPFRQFFHLTAHNYRRRGWPRNLTEDGVVYAQATVLLATQHGPIERNNVTVSELCGA